MKNIIKAFINDLLIGVIAFIPIALIIQIVIYVERFLRQFLLIIYGKYENPLIPLALFAIAIALLGYFGKLLKQDRAHLLYFFERLIDRVPVLGSIYSITRKLLKLFLTGEEPHIRKVVYVEYPKDGMWVPAYVTNRIDDNYILYVPTSPNPTSGFTVIVDKSKIVESTMDMEEVSAFVVSVGVDYDKHDDLSLFKKQ